MNWRISASVTRRSTRKNSVGLIWQLRYARMFNRAYDNSKMLRATGLKQEDFLTLYQGLSREKPYILED